MREGGSSRKEIRGLSHRAGNDACIVAYIAVDSHNKGANRNQHVSHHRGDYGRLILFSATGADAPGARHR